MAFDLGYDGTSPPEIVEIEDGTVLSPIKDPVRSGYQFDGWYTADGKPYNFDTPITESFTLIARWKIKSSGGGGGGGSSAPSEEDLLTGQWNVYIQNPSDPSDPSDFYLYPALIDIQYTRPEYWILMYTHDENHVTGGLI